MTRPDLLTIDDLIIDYGHTDRNAVDGVSLAVHEGETLGLVGESGSGKSSIARAALGLTPYRGSIRFQGQDLDTATKAQWHATRSRLQMIFQDPYSTLDPRIRIGDQIAEPFLVHKAAPRAELPAKVASLLERVGLDPAMARRYPHEFSGGQRQRVAIARAIALHPTLIVCDEPTSALDVSVQAQVLTLLEELQREQNIAYLFIAHNLGVVRRISHRVAVMYLGKIIETGPTDEVFRNPQHPYTRALLDAVLEPDPAERRRAHLAPSDLTSPIDLATGMKEKS
ncbi:ATP-binding cassette domain-containing protein [Microbacterium sp. LRZ72]|uniref:ATP-binding cassette domain-containing protein n=1 Tax=Microbacterium sp. LRZ72 TaxID=2942481 RepID=UPI0029AFC28B|nr:ATP-binding cassette domain-containing protein [Microbacterium sp. LRZ72]MDX2376765.1 ATP-binding cassette domain-containing protein [Microbacterium sp. LRZ72]